MLPIKYKTIYFYNVFCNFVDENRAKATLLPFLNTVAADQQYHARNGTYVTNNAFNELHTIFIHYIQYNI